MFGNKSDKTSETLAIKCFTQTIVKVVTMHFNVVLDWAKSKTFRERSFSHMYCLRQIYITILIEYCSQKALKAQTLSHFSKIGMQLGNPAIRRWAVIGKAHHTKILLLWTLTIAPPPLCFSTIDFFHSHFFQNGLSCILVDFGRSFPTLVLTLSFPPSSPPVD